MDVEDEYHVVRLHDGIKLVPISDDPLTSLREQFAESQRTRDELRAGALETALDEAGR